MILGKIMTGIVIFAAVFGFQLLTVWLYNRADDMYNNLGITLWIIFSVICAFAFMHVLISIGVV